MAWVLSWIFWLALLAAGVATAARSIAHHNAEMALGRRTFDVRYKLCRHLSRTPHPLSPECVARAAADETNLLAPGSPE
jgi:hypothetical protein